MNEDTCTLPKVEVEILRFNSIIDVPKYICSLSSDSKEFLVYSIENNKICAIIPNPIPHENKFKGLICELNGSQLLHFGGLTPKNESLGFCLLIDIKMQSAEFLEPRLPRFFARPVYYENFVYVFGGGGDKESHIACDKYNIRKNKWKIIADLPDPSFQTSTIVFEKKILVAGKRLKHIYNYDPEKNSFIKLFEIRPEAWKIFYLHKNRCYVISGKKECYTSEVNDYKHWHFYGDLETIFWPFSNVCYQNKSAWFIDDESNICKFNLKKLKFKRIASTS